MRQDYSSFSRMAVWGIDLGTTYSSIALCHSETNIAVIPDRSSKYSIASMVVYTEGGDVIVGTAAETRQAGAAERVVFDSKRIIGCNMRHWQDRKAIDDMRLSWPFQIEENSDGYARIRLPALGKSVEAYEVSGEILKYLWELAKETVENPTKQCVITVPANFTAAQREDTLKAARYAGLQVIKMINEPTAAAIAYQKQSGGFPGKKTLLVFDFGGGTLDVSVLECKNSNFQVRGVAGDTKLGGRDIDEALLKFIVKREGLEKIRDAAKDKNNKSAVMKFARLRAAVIAAKIQLSSTTSAPIFVDMIKGEDPLDTTITRKDFDKVCETIFAKILDPVREALAMARIEKDRVDAILLVGGSSKIMKVKEILRDYFGREPFHGVDPEQAVVRGAAIVADDEGAKKGGGKLTIVDVCPMDIGTDIQGGRMSPILVKGSAFGSSASKSYVTTSNFQRNMTVRVYEGPRVKANENKLIGKFKISGIPPKLAQEVSVNVTFSLDMNGMLDIRAECPGTTTQTCRISRENCPYTAQEMLEIERSAEQMEERDEEEVAQSTELYLLDCLYDNISSFIDHEMKESKRRTEAFGLRKLTNIQKSAQEQKNKLRKDNVTIGDVRAAKDEYRAKLKPYFFAGPDAPCEFPKFLC